jgi:hypothetical protein
VTSASRTSDPIAKKARLPTVTLDVIRQCSALAGIRPI